MLPKNMFQGSQYFIIQGYHKDHPEKLYRLDVHVNHFNDIWKKIIDLDEIYEKLVILRVDKYVDIDRPAIYDYYRIITQFILYAIGHNRVRDMKKRTNWD